MKPIVAAVAAALLAATTLPAAAATLNIPASGSASVTLGFDSSSDSSDEAATVHVNSDGKYLYLKFDVPQREPMIGTNGDNVAVELWPTGADGQVFRFGMNLDGSHTSDSTSNTASWEGSAATHPGSYTVTMKIPLDAVHGLGGSASRIQFTRFIASTGDEQTWSHDGKASSDEVAQAGTLTFASATTASTGQ